MLRYDWLIDLSMLKCCIFQTGSGESMPFLTLFSRWWHDKEGAAVASHLGELLWERKERSRM